MSDTPGLIGRNRVGMRATPLGVAMLPGTRRPFDDEREQPVGSVVPKTAEELRADRDERRDAAPMSTACAFCDWAFEGTAGECRDAAAAHRERAHPDAQNRLGRPRMRQVPRHLRTDAENEQGALAAAEARRVRAEREDADRLAKIERGRQRDALAAMDAGEPQDREEEPLGPHRDYEKPGRPRPASSPPPRDDIGPEEASALDVLGPDGVGVSSDPATTRNEGTTMNETVADRLGLKRFGRGYIWTREAMLEAVRVYAAEHGEPPMAEDAKRAPLGMLPSVKSVGAEFSGWDALIVAAGHTPRPKDRGGNHRAAKPGGHTPPPGDGAAPAQAERPASRPEKQRGGRKPTWTREAAIEKLQAESVGGVAPARAAFIASGISNAVIKRLFGTYTEMIQEAGLTPTLAARYQRGAALELSAPSPAPAPTVDFSENALRDPIRTADVPYDADILEDEARFLRRRADALDQLAAGVRAIAAASRREHVEEARAA